jgi:predicted  nucleic acid-binding Zn-ribbon protein
VPTHSLKPRALILCFVLALAAATPLFAGGQKESLIQQANALIASKDYDAASRLLAAIQKEHPELTDQTQALQDTIYAVHEKTNAVEKKLGEAKAAEDDVAMQSLLAELQQLDPKRALTVSQSTKTRVAFLRLMKDADALLSAGKQIGRAHV